ncbi:MAG: proton-conducting transporter membrane subunit [Bryobacterales bacterium]
MLAMVLRKGMFPFHSWVLTAFKRGPLLPAAVLINGHLGAYVVARIAMPAFPEIAGSTLSIVSDLALITAIYAAVVALAERDPRRLIGLLVVSQAAFVLAGLEAATPEGAAGGLIYWMLVTVATTSLAVVYRLIEVRVGRPISGDDFLGLASQFPRLATFFIVSGLALVGLPGTLGFCANELLLHSAMESHPQLGLALPLATALNAFHLYRLFSRLFLGSRGLALPGVPDARPVERWVLTAGLLFLIGGGLFPAKVLHLRMDAAEAIAQTATAATGLPGRFF